MSRLEKWMDDEVALMREYDPRLNEGEYREALAKTLHGEQLKLADAAEDLAGVAFGDALLGAMKTVSDRARDRSLREWFRRHW